MDDGVFTLALPVILVQDTVDIGSVENGNNIVDYNLHLFGEIAQ